MSKRLEIRSAWCKGCGICAAFCPKSVLAIANDEANMVNASACIKCGICESLCPDFAIYLTNEEVEADG